MSHRQIFNAHHIIEPENDHGWNCTEPPHLDIARGAPQSSSVLHSVNNTTVQGGDVSSQWTPALRSSGYPSSVDNVELPNYQPTVPCPSHDLFLRQQTDGNLHMLQGNYPRSHSSSELSRQMVYGADDVSYNHICSCSGTYKRRCPECYDRGSSSRYYEVGMSSGGQVPTGSWQDQQNAGSYHGNWDYPQSYGANSLSISGDYARNVRSRTSHAHTAASSHLSNNSLYHSFSNEQSNPVDLWPPSSDSSTRECAYRSMPPSNNAVMTYGSDSSCYSHYPNPTNMLNNHYNDSREVGCYNNDISLMRNPAPQIVNSHLNQPVREVRTGYLQSSTLAFPATRSNVQSGNILTSDEGQTVSGSSYHHLRDPRPHTTLRFRSVERNRRILNDRYRSPTEANFRMTPESSTGMIHSGIYGSGVILDQHMDMRLDIDDMSYEELLALGERIGSVSTGLSDILISRCLTESVYGSIDPSQDEGTCVICLEEYKDRDDVGTLNACGHDFHVGCIRKWLSMKNLCPICKASALDSK